MFTAASVVARRILRRTGLTPYVHTCLRLITGRRADDYETAVERFLEKTIRPSDIVWDVGANRGVYTHMLSRLVGQGGVVVAIEPERANMTHLASCEWPITNVVLVHAALTDHDGEMPLYVNSADSSGRTHSLSHSNTHSSTPQTVSCFSGDSLIQRQLAPTPSFVKIDVDGAEEQVLAGLAHTLQAATLRGVLVEVHFSALERQGRPFAPISIEKFLRDRNLRVRWLDRSRIAAVRD
jgi:FkbM family methyltransferase